MVIYWRDSLLLISCKVCTFVCFYLIKSSLDKFQNWINFLWNSEITKTLYQYIIWQKLTSIYPCTSIVMLPHHRLGHNSSECIVNQMRLQNKDTHVCIPRVKSVLKIKKIKYPLHVRHLTQERQPIFPTFP